MATLVHLLLLLPPLPPARSPDYCALCRVPGTHTRCLYPQAGPSPDCSGYVPAPLSPGEQRALLDTHNALRSRVALGQGWSPNSTHDAQPKAANMRRMYWDRELADTAQRWADRCDSFYTTQPHDQCRDSPRFPVGQNIVTTAYNFPLPPDVRARVRDWYNEISDFDPAWVSSFALQPAPGKTTAHYTQLAWGWTYLLGCGRAVFHEVIDGEIWMVERLVCNYGPSGNFFDVPVYEMGEPCSKCPNGTRCSDEYPGLCEIDDTYTGTTTAMPPLWSFTTTTTTPTTTTNASTAAPSSTTQASITQTSTTQRATTGGSTAAPASSSPQPTEVSEEEETTTAQPTTGPEVVEVSVGELGDAGNAL